METVVAQRFEITGAPLDFEGTPVQVRVEAERAELRFAGQPADGYVVAVDVTCVVRLEDVALQADYRDLRLHGTAA